MKYNDQLEEEFDRVNRLKANLHLRAIQDYLKEARRKWKPKTTEIEASDRTRFADGDSESGTLYFDEYNLVWTSKDIAFKGHVFKQISEIVGTVDGGKEVKSCQVRK